MSFTNEIYELLIRYAKDYQGKTVTREYLMNRPWYKCVWGHWRAKAYYKKDGYYERLEDVPAGLNEYTIITDKLSTQYSADGHTQEITYESCKVFYGKGN